MVLYRAYKRNPPSSSFALRLRDPIAYEQLFDLKTTWKNQVCERFILSVLISILRKHNATVVSRRFLIISSNTQVIEYASLECATQYKRRFRYVNGTW